VLFCLQICRQSEQNICRELFKTTGFFGRSLHTPQSKPGISLFSTLKYSGEELFLLKANDFFGEQKEEGRQFNDFT
jgi:hypothetical protein